MNSSDRRHDIHPPADPAGSKGHDAAQMGSVTRRQRIHLFETGVISLTTAVALVVLTLAALSCFAQFRYQRLIGDSRVAVVDFYYLKCHAQLLSFVDQADRQSWLTTLGKVVYAGQNRHRTFAFDGGTWPSPVPLIDIEHLPEAKRLETFSLHGDVRWLEFLFPLWVPFLFFSAVAAFVLHRGPVRRHRRHRRGRCWRCGYDLTALLSNVCPECGRSVAELPPTLRRVLVVCAGSSALLAGLVGVTCILPLARTRTALGSHFAREPEIPRKPPEAPLEDVIYIARERAAMALQIETDVGYLPPAETCVLLDTDKARYEISGVMTDKARCPRAPLRWTIIIQVDEGPAFRPVFVKVGDEVMLDDR